MGPWGRRARSKPTELRESCSDPPPFICFPSSLPKESFLMIQKPHPGEQVPNPVPSPCPKSPISHFHAYSDPPTHLPVGKACHIAPHFISSIHPLPPSLLPLCGTLSRTLKAHSLQWSTSRLHFPGSHQQYPACFNTPFRPQCQLPASRDPFSFIPMSRLLPRSCHAPRGPSSRVAPSLPPTPSFYPRDPASAIASLFQNPPIISNVSHSYSPLPLAPYLQRPVASRPPMYPQAQNHRSVPGFPAFDRPQSRELAPGPDQGTAEGGLVSARPKLQSARGPTLLPSPTRARPSYHGDPRPDPSCPGPAATGRLPLCKVLGDPGLERTSGRRIRLPSSAQPAGNCSPKDGFARQGVTVGKRDGPSSQHPEKLSVFLCPVQTPHAC